MANQTQQTNKHADALRQLDQQLARLYKESAQAMYVFLDEEHKSCNARFADLLGYPSPEAWAAVRQPFTGAFVQPKSQATLVDTYQDALDRGVGAQIDVTWRSKGGASVPTRVILVPIEFSGHRMALHFVDPA